VRKLVKICTATTLSVGQTLNYPTVDAKRRCCNCSRFMWLAGEDLPAARRVDVY